MPRTLIILSLILCTSRLSTISPWTLDPYAIVIALITNALEVTPTSAATTTTATMVASFVVFIIVRLFPIAPQRPLPHHMDVNSV